MVETWSQHVKTPYILDTDREYNFEEAVGVKNDFINLGLDPHYGGGANSHTSHTSADEVCEKCAGTWPRELGTHNLALRGALDAY